jgi:hypothetical protein
MSIPLSTGYVADFRCAQQPDESDLPRRAAGLMASYDGNRNARQEEHFGIVSGDLYLQQPIG